MNRAAGEVLVVGAGAAGLTAARELSAHGISVSILEARNRIGGRIYTYRHGAEALPVELGAEFVHGKPPEILDLIGPSQLKIREVAERHWFIMQGRLVKSAEFWDKIEAIMDRMKCDPEDRTFEQFLDTLPNDPETAEAKKMAGRFVQDFHAGLINRIGTQGLNRVNEASESIDGEAAFRFPGGYAELCDWLCAEAMRHGAIVHLSTAVTEISWRKNEVSVLTTSDELERLVARRCLITLPLGVLQAGSVKFNPAVPNEVVNAINNLATGHVAKIILQFRERFWEDLELPIEDGSQSLEPLSFIHSFKPPFPTWWTTLPVLTPLLVGWVGGPEAITLLKNDDEVIIDQAINALANLLRIQVIGLREKLVSAHFHNWQSDPWSRVAYSYLPVGGLKAQAVLSDPIEQTLFFAGEALSDGHIGTVHGAMMSGARAAAEILRSL